MTINVGDLVVCAHPEPGRHALLTPGQVYRVSRKAIINYIKHGPQDEIRLEADDTGAPSASHPEAWFRPLLACWHVSINEWCLPCGRWEPDRDGDFLACLECHHVYRTPEDLVAEENNIRRRMGDPELVIDGNVREVVGQIYSCPLCTHDW